MKYDQHFLICNDIVDSIISELKPSKEDNILEIGPGKGALTKKLEKFNLTVVEIDKNLSMKLKESHTNINIIDKSILDVEDDFLIKNNINKIVSNLPYYISEPFFYKFLTWFNHLKQKDRTKSIEAIFMTGEHFYNSILGSFSPYGDFINAFFTITFEKEVKKECFDPNPRVKSYVFKLEEKNNNSYDEEISKYIYKKYIKGTEIKNIIKSFLWNFKKYKKKIAKEKAKSFVSENKLENKKIDNLTMREYFQLKDFLLSFK